MRRAGRLSISLLTISTILSSLSSYALEPGRRVPDIHVDKWYSSDSQKDVSKKSDKAVDVVMIFDANDPSALAFLKMLESIQNSMPSQIKSVKAIAKNSPRQLEELLSHSGQLSYPVGTDTSNFITFKEYCDTESMLPLAFVVLPDGALAWSGHPTGIESVIKRIDNGTFDIDSQRRISALRIELQTALRSGLGAVVLKNADRILAIDPSDMISVQAKLFVFEGQSKFKEAGEFLSDAVAKNPKELELRLVYLNFLVRVGDMDTYKSETAKCFESFKDNPSALSKFCAFVMENSPFGNMPVALAREAAKIYADSLGDSNTKETKAFAYELQAQASYYSGDLPAAIEFQVKSTELRKGGPYEAPASKILDFYKSIK